MAEFRYGMDDVGLTTFLPRIDIGLFMSNAKPVNKNVRQTMFGANDWFSWAILSAVFAAMTAIFAKVGLKGVDSDYATLFRTFVIILVLGVFVAVSKKWRNPFTLSSQTVTFLVLSGLATGASWVCYFRAFESWRRIQGSSRGQA